MFAVQLNSGPLVLVVTAVIRHRKIETRRERVGGWGSELFLGLYIFPGQESKLENCLRSKPLGLWEEMSYPLLSAFPHIQVYIHSRPVQEMRNRNTWIDRTVSEPYMSKTCGRRRTIDRSPGEAKFFTCDVC